MKRLLVLVLALLVLAGCGKQADEPPNTTIQQETQPDPGWYVPDSEMERITDGAVQMYDLPANDVLWIGKLGNNLLLAGTSGFTVLSGEKCTVSATMTPEIKITGNMEGFQFTSHGLAYYLAKRNEVVHLDQQLQVISRIELPEKPDGVPVITTDASEIFYCIGDEIRAYDTARNITRPVKNQLVKKQTLTDSLFGGDILSCSVVYDNGEEGVVYLDSQTGETCSTDPQTAVTDTDADTYFAINDDGLLRQEIFGTRTTEPSALDIPDEIELIPAAALNGVVGVTVDEGKPVQLSLYDFETACITSAVKLSGVDKIVSSCVDKMSGSLWLLVETEGDRALYRWNPEKSKTEDSASLLVPLYSPENPDAEQLSACESRVKGMNRTYGISISIWQDAVSETGENSVTVEYRPEAIQAYLDKLETVLQMFPEKFLRKSATRPLQLCIVRTINGGTESVQFYKNRNAYIFLSTGGDPKQELIRGLGYVINSRVVSNTSLLDSWVKLNPDGFAYGQGKAEHLSGEQRAFADKKAMTSVVEDRSSVFRYAMEEGNAEIFASKTMQKKLELLCKGIRRVWKWNKEEMSYPWEQYLNEPLAYKK